MLYIFKTYIFTEILNQHSSVKMKFNLDHNSVKFLDMVIFKGPYFDQTRQLHMKIYFKGTDTPGFPTQTCIYLIIKVPQNDQTLILTSHVWHYHFKHQHSPLITSFLQQKLFTLSYC